MSEEAVHTAIGRENPDSRPAPDPRSGEVDALFDAAALAPPTRTRSAYPVGGPSLTSKDEAKGIDLLDPVLADWRWSSPWARGEGGAEYHPDFALLERLLEVPVKRGAQSQSGEYGKALDAWFANEFRRAGFDPDLVWPRATRPRVLPGSVTALIRALPREYAEDLSRRLHALPAVAPQDARIRGRAYDKQVDVVMSHWATGPELLLSTKAQNSSFGNNLANRFEEAYGDAGNLRARHPLAAVGFAFAMRSTVLDQPTQLRKAIDMLDKLRDRGDGNGYTSTCLIITEWSDEGEVRILHEAVPAHLGAGVLMRELITTILDNAPFLEHSRARDLLAEAEAGGWPG